MTLKGRRGGEVRGFWGFSNKNNNNKKSVQKKSTGEALKLNSEAFIRYFVKHFLS